MAKYTYGSNKGGIKQGQVIADPWSIKARTEDNMRYTSKAVVETLTNGQTRVAWTPVVEGSAKFLNAEGAVVAGGSVAADGTITLPGEGTPVKVAYEYDNVKIPQDDLPIVNVEMANIPLVAKARRVAIYYSQIAA